MNEVRQPSRIRVGVGGWVFEPWRNNFYPAGWPHARELEFASRQFGVIEINGTFYHLQKPATYARWAAEAPEGFKFSLKASRFCTYRRVLAEAAESVQRFSGSGIAELGLKLGPIVWQFAPTKRFEPDDLGAFIDMLPQQVDGVPLQHALEVRHESFKCAEYVELARGRAITTVFTDSPDYPSFADISGSFVYARIMRTESQLADGCTPEALDQLAACSLSWRNGDEPAGLPRLGAASSAGASRDVYLFFISAAKEKAPAAALALQVRLARLDI